MTADVIGILRGTDLLRSAPAEDLEALAAASRLRTFRRGQVVFTAGDPGDTLIVVISGRVKVVVRSADGGELTLTVIGSGGVFGELSVADSGPRSADAETLEESQLLLIPRATVQDICARVPSAAQALTEFPRGHASAAHRSGVRPGLPGPAPARRQGAAQPAQGRRRYDPAQA